MTPIATIKIEPGAAFVLQHSASLKPGVHELYDRAQVERMIALAHSGKSGAPSYQSKK